MLAYAEDWKTRQPAPSVRPQAVSRLHAAEQRGPGSLLHLQRTVGNQAVQRLLETRRARSASEPSAPLQRKCACEGSGAPCASCAAEQDEGKEEEGKTAPAQAGFAGDTPAALPAQAPPAAAPQKQAGDPFSDPFGEGEKPKADRVKSRAEEACGDPCGKFPWVEVAPDVFFALCDDTVHMSSPEIAVGGCTPGRLGNVGLFSGSPAWQMPTNCDTCSVTGKGSKAGPTTGIKVGYIQTVENCLSGGVYFQQDPSGKWVWAGNEWYCVANARDGHKASTAPWYGPDDQGKLGPEAFGTCPALADHPYVVLPSGQNVQNKGGVDRPQWPLRRMRIDGIFHTWLIAQPPSGAPVYIHHWSFKCWVVAELADDADPCNRSGWTKMDMKSLIASGPGKGSANPVTSGGIANDIKKRC